MRFLRIRPLQDSSKWNLSARRLNEILRLSGGTNYLEVGVYAGRTFENVEAAQRVGVDPYPRFFRWPRPEGARFFESTSREYFDSWDGEQFDLIFLDGLHEAQETLQDVIDSVRVLAEGGIILIDDVLPADFESSIPDEIASRQAKEQKGILHRAWYGDVWRVAEAIRLNDKLFDFLLVGDGEGEHCQAAIRLIGSRDEAQRALIEYRKTLHALDFHEAVEGNLRPIARAENEALSLISTWF